MHEKALKVAERYGYTMYDSLVLAAALTAKTSTIYTEDMNDGQVIEDTLTIRNPFKVSKSPRVAIADGHSVVRLIFLCGIHGELF